jgi:peptidoglycan hydrolase CwlO-like protein
MGKADEIAMFVGYDSMNALLWTLRRRAGIPTCESQVDFLNAARAIEHLMNEVERLSDKVERLSDKVDDLKEEIRNHQES